MNVDVVDLRDFYAKRLGRAAQQSITMAISSVMQQSAKAGSTQRLLTIGYAVPYLDKFAADAERAFAFMPAAQGAVQWPSGKLSSTALIHDEELPLLDSSVDTIIMIHSLEHSENVHESLSEAWRVLAPNGRLIVVVPNRRGLWARFEHTPFGTGRPFSRGQLMRQMRDAMFTPDIWADALNFPPARRRSILRFHNSLERMGRRLWPAFSGATVVLATKRLYQGLPVGAKARRKVFVPVLAPQGNTRTQQRRSN